MLEQPAGIMLFAAGLGLRMRPLSLDRPKCLVQVGGVPLIDHAIGLAREAHISPIVVNAHHHADQLAQHLAGRDIAVSVEAEAALETGGGLKKALRLLGPRNNSPVFTLNTDAVWLGDNPLAQLARAWQDRMDALLLLIPDRGACDFSLGSDGCVQRGQGFRYTGAQIIRPERVAAAQEGAFSLNQVWDEMITAGTAYGLVMEGGWCDVGDPKAIERAEKMLSSADG